MSAPGPEAERENVQQIWKGQQERSSVATSALIIHPVFIVQYSSLLSLNKDINEPAYDRHMGTEVWTSHGLSIKLKKKKSGPLLSSVVGNTPLGFTS